MQSTAHTDLSPIRVTHIAKTTGHGGVAVAVADWCGAMARYGVDSRVFYIADREHERIASEFDRHGIRCNVASSSVAALREVTGIGIANLARLGSPRILHVHTGLPVIRRSADTLRRLAGARSPSIISLHGPTAMASGDRHAPTWATHRAYASRWSLLTAPSEYETNAHAAAIDASSALKCVKCCCEPVAAEPGALRSMLGVPESDPLLVSIGRLHIGQKDPVTVLDAFELICSESTNARLVFIGDGEDRPAVEARIRSLPSAMAVRVHVLGHLRSPARLLADAFAFLAASRAESFGLVAYEAALAGAPLVLSAIQPWQSMFREGDESRFFAPGDARALASVVLDLLRHPEQARSMAARAREVAQRDADPAQIGRVWRDVYESVLRRERMSRSADVGVRQTTA